MKGMGVRLRHGAIACLVLLATVCATATAEDWPQWRGAHRSGATTQKIATTWPTTRPAEVWHADVGKGHAAVSIADGKAVTLGYTGKGDTVWCLGAATGKELWRFEYTAIARVKNEPGGGAFDGPHAAPTIDKGRVFTLSRDGQVHCLDFATGKPVWKRDLQADLKAMLPECGFSGAPLVADGKVFVNVCQTGTALDAESGKTLWQSGEGIAGYGAPVLHEDAKGKKRLLLFGFKALAAVDPADGKVLWTFPWPTQFGANVADPIVVGDGVFISSAYKRGCAFVDLAGGELKWKNKALGSQCSPLVPHEGNLYGFDGYINWPGGGQALVCLDPADGTERWRKKGLAGQMILADGKLVMLLTTGDLVIANVSPKGYEELVRAGVTPAEECPVPPTLVDGRLYCRTGKGRVVCLDVKP